MAEVMLNTSKTILTNFMHSLSAKIDSSYRKMLVHVHDVDHLFACPAHSIEMKLALEATATATSIRLSKPTNVSICNISFLVWNNVEAVARPCS